MVNYKKSLSILINRSITELYNPKLGKTVGAKRILWSVGGQKGKHLFQFDAFAFAVDG